MPCHGKRQVPQGLAQRSDGNLQGEDLRQTIEMPTRRHAIMQVPQELARRSGGNLQRGDMRQAIETPAHRHAMQRGRCRKGLRQILSAKISPWRSGGDFQGENLQQVLELAALGHPAGEGGGPGGGHVQVAGKGNEVEVALQVVQPQRSCCCCHAVPCQSVKWAHATQWPW